MWKWIRRHFAPNLWQAYQEWSTDGGFTLAASLAYYGVLSAFPLLIVVMAVLGWLLSFSHLAQQQREQLLHVVEQSTSPQFEKQIGELLDQVQEMAKVNGPVAVATLLFGAIGIFAHLDLSFDRIWKVPPATESVGYLHTIYDVLHGKFRAFLMMLLMGVVMVAAFIGSMIITGLREFAVGLPAGNFIWHLTQSATGVGINSAYFFVIYKSLSKRRIRWREAAGGALLAGIAWEIGRQVLASFVIGKNYSAYGVVGAFIAMLLWFFYASCLLFYGAEFVQVMAKKREIAAGHLSPKNPLSTGDASRT